MKGMSMRYLLVILLTGLFVLTERAHAAGSDDPPKAVDLAEFIAAKKHVQSENYKEATSLLQKVVAAQPQNVSALNLLAYSQRKSDDLKASLANYKKALALDPSHKDAHEYIGELYLRLGDLVRAEEHLSRLDQICFFGCEQLDELKAAITAYKKKRGQS
tara:strand:+ start:77 stop:556 length:480 start_codon:yes stop_codon:yes gene_type:complete